MKDNGAFANNLINEKSPYLLQHAYNPIDWYPWCDEAFKKAEEEDKPIFLSIGYSTCHWCHVMAKESFEDNEVAEYMNKNFVAIKVDREERPDIDSVYMTVCQSLTGHGGWPLTILMTPDQKPFYAGTYFPKKSRYNMPGLMDVLISVEKAWREDRSKLLYTVDQILDHLESLKESSSDEISLDKGFLYDAYDELRSNFEHKYGGFGSEPKFPTPHKLMYLLRYYNDTKQKAALDMVEKTLESMYKGGIFDHIGYGFSRYSTDNMWLVPHFEKMLYDNALLILAYIEAYEITKKDLYKEIAIKTLDYVIKVLRDEEGGFYSAEDADSEGEEGKYYVFNPLEIIDILGEEDGKYFNDYYDITPGGNFEGKNIPNLINNKVWNIDDSKISKCREKILRYREGRMNLHKDDKILTSWNGLMIGALGKAYRVIGEEKYLKYAKSAIDFIYNNLFDSKGRLLARYRDGDASFNGYLEDYAFLTFGLMEVYGGTFELDYLKKSTALTKDMISLFWDKGEDGFYIYGEDSDKLITRPKELFDGALPSGNSVAAYNLITLARITGDEKLEEYAGKQMNFISSRLYGGKINYSFFLMAATLYILPTKELVCVVKDNDNLYELKKDIDELKRFGLNIIVKTDENSDELSELAPFTEDYKLVNNKETFYYCEGFTCHQPSNDIRSIKKLVN